MTTEKDLIEDLTGFPIEIVEKMLDEQEKQGNKRNVRVFQIQSVTPKKFGGFDWVEAEDKCFFWDAIIKNRDFTTFFKKYPKNNKKTMNYKIGDTVKILDEGKCYDNYSSLFKKLGFKNSTKNHAKGLRHSIGKIFEIEKDFPVEHSKFAVRFKNGREVLVSTNGIELVKPITKQITLTTEQAKELYNSNKEFRDTLLSGFTDEELGIEVELREWEDCVNDLGKFYPSHTGYIEKENPSLRGDDSHLNTPNEKVAKSLIAMAKLSILKADLGEECKTTNITPPIKYSIIRKGSFNKIIEHQGTLHFLSFQTKRVAERFLEKHSKLINDYSNLFI